MKHNKTKRKKLTKTGRVFFKLLFFIACLTLITCAYVLYQNYRGYREGDKAYQEVDDIAVVVTTNNETKIDFDSLLEFNEDYIGWLSLEDSRINYPVVQGDDNEYYLEHLFTKEVNHMGCIFIDYRNASNFTDKNTVIYGHHTNTGSMFYTLENYKDQNYYNGHKKFTFETEHTEYCLEPFAGVLIDGEEPFIRFTFEDDEDFMEYIRYFRKDSLFQSPVTIKDSDRIVTMITCTDDFYNARLALFCRLTEKEKAA